MSTFADRLRDVVRPAAPRRELVVERDEDERVSAEEASQESRVRHTRPGPQQAADLLGGEWLAGQDQQVLVVDRKYTPGHRHGRLTVADALPPDDGPWARLSLLAGASCRGRMLFVDLETTGLAGGAGTYAFLVGCAWFDGAAFRVRQFFLSNFAAERLLLDAVAEVADAAGAVVTYNGKSFDLPLIETRYVLHRRESPFSALPHVDMVHHARRLWRNRGEASATASDGGTSSAWTAGDIGRRAMVPAGTLGGRWERRAPGEGERGDGCRLVDLEQSLCGYGREGDVPGFEIPARYFHYVRTGDARGLGPVMEHNRLDLVSLALVTARASQLLDEGASAAATAREALGLGKLYERAGLLGEARAAYERAADMPRAGDEVRADALRALAVLARRDRRHADAAAAWLRILSLDRCPPNIVREATEALAVHHEHRLRDPHAARGFALQSLQHMQSASRTRALHHRVARLDRKIATPGTSAPLF